MKNSFYLVDKSTGIQEKKINFFLKEMHYVGLHKGDFEQHNEVFFILNTILVGNANNFFSKTISCKLSVVKNLAMGFRSKAVLEPNLI